MREEGRRGRERGRGRRKEGEGHESGCAKFLVKIGQVM